jgi:hypothetical protein
MYVLALFSGLRAQFARFANSDERGDVPGWVMITVITAIAFRVVSGASS